MITEGSCSIFNEGNVFYNPVQQFNRDLSISVLTTYSYLYRKFGSSNSRFVLDGPEEVDCSKDFDEFLQTSRGVRCEDGIDILEALSATGLRSIRYAKEIPGIRKIVANDLSRQAVASIMKNVEHNDVGNIIVGNEGDAIQVMYSRGERFQAIDLDPYGCPSRFLDGAIQNLKDGGLLLVTATDMAVLAGNTPEACLVKYGSVPLRTKACHEMALRILLNSIESTATRYGRYIHPLLSISVDFYVRVFVQIFTGSLECKKSGAKRSMVFQCCGCDAQTFQPLISTKPNPKNEKQTKYGLPTGPFANRKCSNCGFTHHMGGPFWTAPIHDESFIKLVLKVIPKLTLGTYDRVLGQLSVIGEELKDVPLYYCVEKLCSIVKLEPIPMLKLRSALLNAGYRVSYSHACKTSVKTDAPATVLWDIMRCWAKVKPVNPNRFLEGTPLKALLEKAPEKDDYDFNTMHPDANPKSRKESLKRFPENPAAHWGPGTRATLM